MKKKNNKGVEYNHIRGFLLFFLAIIIIFGIINIRGLSITFWLYFILCNLLINSYNYYLGELKEEL